ncbi:helix-hairpin-helix domain-containing protein [Noviherbaspirillum sp. DKR-6]|uniref:Helix-hairpin-helix domain-containing protein n=2 Tax=Noviherbaspirillum pedocola TaxID=2801341 RepID=A0A934SM55_9BURK|nr:helix-hairpin-helix domain-containing protein [Noviherbaspirillum pedocola]
MLAGFAFADADVNKADQAALDGIKGIGPVISKRIIDERQAHGPYKDWADFEQRVKGIGDKKAASLSQGGLTVNGQAMPNAPAKSAAAASKPSSSTSMSEAGSTKAGARNGASTKGSGVNNPFTPSGGAPASKPAAPAPAPAR